MEAKEETNTIEQMKTVPIAFAVEDVLYNLQIQKLDRCDMTKMILSLVNADSRLLDMSAEEVVRRYPSPNKEAISLGTSQVFLDGLTGLDKVGRVIFLRGQSWEESRAKINDALMKKGCYPLGPHTPPPKSKYDLIAAIAATSKQGRPVRFIHINHA